MASPRTMRERVRPVDDVQVVVPTRMDPPDDESNESSSSSEGDWSCRRVLVHIIDHLPFYEVYEDLYGDGFLARVPAYTTMDQMVYRYLRVANLHSRIDRTKIAVLDDNGRVLDGPASFNVYCPRGQRGINLHLVLRPVGSMARARVYLESKIRRFRNRQRDSEEHSVWERTCCRRFCPFLFTSVMNAIAFCVILPMMVCALLAYIRFSANQTAEVPQMALPGSQNLMKSMHGIIVEDGGTSDTPWSVHLWNGGKLDQALPKETYSCDFKIRPELTPSELCIQPLNNSCLNEVVDMVLVEDRRATPVYLIGSEDHVPDCNWQRFRNFFRQKGLRVQRIQVLSDAIKAMLRWMALNHSQKRPGNRSMVGYVRWGPHSSEISFPIQEGSDVLGSKNEATVSRDALDPSVWVYAASDSCRGQSGLLGRYLIQLAKTLGKAPRAPKIVVSPCHGKNRTGVVDIKATMDGSDCFNATDERLPTDLFYKGSGDVDACGVVLASEGRPPTPPPRDGLRTFLGFDTNLRPLEAFKGASSSTETGMDLENLRSSVDRICKVSNVDHGEADLCLQANLMYQDFATGNGFVDSLPKVKLLLNPFKAVDWTAGFMLEKTAAVAPVPRPPLKLTGLYIFLTLLGLGAMFTVSNYFSWVDH